MFLTAPCPPRKDKSPEAPKMLTIGGAKLTPSPALREAAR